MRPWNAMFKLGMRRILWTVMAVMISACEVEFGVSGLGSMSSLAASYGENGATLCGLNADGSHRVNCFGSDESIVYGAPLRIAFSGLSGGDGFVCGLVMSSSQPYCWGNNIYVQMGVPPALEKSASYAEISAGDHHVCALRRAPEPSVDCWGYNMTGSYMRGAVFSSITAGSLFTCGLFAANATAVCWGDDSESGAISGVPRGARFRTIAAGGYHVCGILLGEDRTLCWGQNGSPPPPPPGKFSALVGGKFQACGLDARKRSARCWGMALPNGTSPPANVELLALAAGDYFTCGVSNRGLQLVCWGCSYPTNLPLAVAPGVCRSRPCEPGTYQFSPAACDGYTRVCVACSGECPPGTFQSAACTPDADRQCTGIDSGSHEKKRRKKHIGSLQTPIIIGELGTAVVVVSILSLVALVWVRFKLLSRAAAASLPPSKFVSSGNNNNNNNNNNNSSSSVKKGKEKELKNMRRAEVFSYEELETATGGFSKELQVGKGSFSNVFKALLRDGRVVAVKRPVNTNTNMTYTEFRKELDLLSRLNHAHLLNLLGYCEEKGERLLVYEFMAHGTLHELLHGKSVEQQLGWIRRVTIAVQAARGLEYLHGYACPPVIHRDIKSSNILIDQEHNARVADFGLSLFGPADGDSPLSEPPAGTLGYLDPEYYRLHYLTTKSDVYSFGVLLLEILSGRKAIDMQYEEGNIVEWAVPLIKSGDIAAILDPRLEPPLNYEALYRIARVAYRCVRMRGKDRPSMGKVTTALERALAVLMGTPCDEQPILPTEVVLGSSRLHRKPSHCSDIECRAPSWITFPSLPSSQRRKSSVSEPEAAPHRNEQAVPEIGPASPQQELFLQNNF